MATVNRYAGCTVAFTDDLTEADAARIVAAIALIRGVAGVEQRAVDVVDHMARIRVKRELKAGIDAVFGDGEAKG